MFAIQPTFMEVEYQVWHLKHSGKITEKSMKARDTERKTFE